MPGLGMKVSGSSALMRHSIAWPRGAMSSCLIDSGFKHGGRNIHYLEKRIREQKEKAMGLGS
jgi:hypothetical protein